MDQNPYFAIGFIVTFVALLCIAVFQFVSQMNFENSCKNYANSVNSAYKADKVNSLCYVNDGTGKYTIVDVK